MKKIIVYLIALLISIDIWAQAPQMMGYQAIIRNSSDKLVKSSTIGMKISLLQGSSTGDPVYVEIQTPSTNINGLVTIQIGNGNAVSGSFSGIDWSAGPYYLKTEADPDGGTNYSITGTSMLMSVPYALYAANAGTPANGWNINGNAGTSDTSNFIGTTDMVPFNIRVNNQPSGRIDSVSGNTFLGYRAGNFPDNTGTKNSALGYYTLKENTTGDNNTALGFAALRDNTSGSNNTGLGFCQMTFNTTGGSNTALGTWALFKNTTASYNTAVGDSALYSNTTGSPNTAMGYGSMVANTIGKNNTSVGYLSMRDNTSGDNNTSLGHASLRDNTSGSNNTGLGFCQMTFNTTGGSNTALGTWALFKNTTASYNTAVGDSALYSNTTGSPNTAMGYGSMVANTIGKNNTSVGYLSMRDNTSGDNNTSLGHASLRDNTSGSNNTGLGFCQMTFNTTGGSNTALGTWALFKNTTASYNSVVGDSALYSNTTGAGNTSVGYGALVSNLTGNNNTAIGYMADAGTAHNNTTVIGYQATASEDNVIVLGNASVQKLYCAQTTITAISDGRFKKNISNDIHGLDFITKLHPVSYQLNVSKLNDFQGKKTSEADQESVEKAERIVHNGFIAQDVEKAAKEVGYNFSGLKTPGDSKDIYGLGYTDFVVPLVKAVQELNEANEKLKAENEMLKAQLTDQENALNNLQAAQQKSEEAFNELKNWIILNNKMASLSK